MCEEQGMVLAILDNKERYDKAFEFLKSKTYVFIMIQYHLSNGINVKYTCDLSIIWLCLCSTFTVLKYCNLLSLRSIFISHRGSWSWPYGSWIGFKTTCAISAYHHCCFEFESSTSEVCSIQHYVIKFVSDLWQVFRCTPVSSTNKTNRHVIAEILLKVALNTINQNIKKLS